MEDYYLFSSGKLERKDNTVRLTRNDGKYKDLKIELTKDLYCFGQIETNTDCLNYLAHFGVPVHFFNYYSFYTGSFYPRQTSVSGTVLLKQVQAYLNDQHRLYYAKKFISGAAENILRNLKYYQNKGRDLQSYIDNIESLLKQLDNMQTVDEAMGIEGKIHIEYYSAWQKIFNKDVDFTKRVRRPPDNMVNTLISFLNTMMYTTCLSEIYTTQLNPAISFLHSTNERKFSLCLDISEIFKPIVVDRLIFSLINKNMITENDFEKQSNFCYMKPKTKQKVVKAYYDYLQTTIMHRKLHRKVSYQHLIKLECYKLIKSLTEDEPYEPFKMWW